jgi:hypothetical protein
MRIECRITGIDPQPPLLDYFRRVLDHAAKLVDLDKAMVDRVIVASHDRFGDAVRALKHGATHTDTEIGVAGGKTIARTSGSAVVSDIALQGSLFEVLAEVLGGPSIPNGWDVDQQQALYVICHELGHARDNALRPAATDKPDPRNGPFSLDATTAYYGEIVLSEYVACWLATPAITPALFDHEMGEAAKRMASYREQTDHHISKPEELTRRALGHFVCQAAWLFVTELAKLYGHATGQASRDAKVRGIERGLLGATPLGDALTALAESYPGWDTSAQAEQLGDVMQQYAGMFGVRFVKSAAFPDDFEATKLPHQGDRGELE